MRPILNTQVCLHYFVDVDALCTNYPVPKTIISKVRKFRKLIFFTKLVILAQLQCVHSGTFSLPALSNVILYHNFT